MAFAVAILMVGRYFVDAIRYMADVQFRVVQREDVTVTFHEPLPRARATSSATLPGVMRAEPFRAVPARLRSSTRPRRVALHRPRGGHRAAPHHRRATCSRRAAAAAKACC